MCGWHRLDHSREGVIVPSVLTILYPQLVANLATNCDFRMMFGAMNCNCYQLKLFVWWGDRNLSTGRTLIHFPCINHPHQTAAWASPCIRRAQGRTSKQMTTFVWLLPPLSSSPLLPVSLAHSYILTFQMMTSSLLFLSQVHWESSFTWGKEDWTKGKRRTGKTEAAEWKGQSAPRIKLG